MLVFDLKKKLVSGTALLVVVAVVVVGEVDAPPTPFKVTSTASGGSHGRKDVAWQRPLYPASFVERVDPLISHSFCFFFLTTLLYLVGVVSLVVGVGRIRAKVSDVQ